MKSSDANVFVCPRCHAPIRLLEAHASDSIPGEIDEGRFVCETCRVGYPIRNFIPRFVSVGNYADSFGYQWNAFSRVQTSAVQMPHNRERFFATTGWAEDLRGQRVLEVGCGAGRFAGVALETGAEVYSFDLSVAVEVCFGNITEPDQKKKHHLFQASIDEIPLPNGMFDKIFCLGVLQHCPDVKKAFLSLVPFLKPGGELAVDCYWSQPLRHLFNLKYWLRPFFKWWKPSFLFSFWSAVISVAYDLKVFLSKIPRIGAMLARVIPIGRLNFEPEMHLTIDEIKKIKTLSVFDMLRPQFDQPQKLSSFDSWTREAGLDLILLTLGYNGINVRARRPLSPE